MILIKNGKVLTMDGHVYKNGSVLIKDGKIAGVGGDAIMPESGWTVIDATGKIVTPGLIDAHTHLGISENSIRWEGNDTNEVTDPVTPHLRALDAINPMCESLMEAVIGGVTSVVTSPGSANVIGGQTVAMKTGGSNRIDDLVIKSPHSIKCALGENPKGAYGQAKKVAPSTRMATAAIFRETLIKAKEYLDKKDRAGATEDEKDKKEPDYNMKYEALIPVLRREIPVHFHAHRADDIHTAIRLTKEFNIRCVLIHSTDAHLILDDIKESGYATIIGPTLTNKSKPEVKNKTFETAGIVQRAGILTCITTDHPVTPLQHLNVCAALCVQAGMDEDEALKAITIYAARVMHLDDRIGSIAPGKDADIVIWDAHPLLTTAHAETVIIDGKVLYNR
ncbi:MAG: amidohydrolase [Defluviitaleaceae bacterium]|nr:amidohydrolase [Defluviitaleaceae bacterium]